MPALASKNRILRTSIDVKSRKHNRLPCLVQTFIDLCSRGELKEAVESLEPLESRGLRLDSRKLAFILRQCATSRSLREGKLLHLHLKLTGRKVPNTFLSNHLIHMYFKCGDHNGARQLFDKMTVRNLFTWNNMLAGYTKLGMLKPANRLFDQMPEKDVVSWNTMVTALAQNGAFDEALRFYTRLRSCTSLRLNEYSFAGVLTVCVKLEEMGLTMQVHCQVLVCGFLPNVVISSSIMDAYAKCGMIHDAERLFDDMPVRDVPAWTTLVSGYSKLGDLKAAKKLFDEMPEKNPVSWTSLISGYAQNGKGHEALELFAKMMTIAVRPDQFTYSNTLCACAVTCSLKHGKQIQAYLIRIQFNPNTVVISSLIDMYSKCGTVEVGQRVFCVMGNKQDVVLWNTMISALAQHGLGEEAIRMFDEMVRSGIKPDRITFVVILTACSHSGHLQEGLRIFESMTRDHHIVHDQEHYACLVDLLGRAGHIDDITQQLEKMHCKPDAWVWNAVLSACRIHGNVYLGRIAAENLIDLEPQSCAAYLLLSNIYAALGKWESVEKIRHLMNERHVRKDRAISWVEIENKIHAFSVSDRLHPLKEEIYFVLDTLAGLMEDE